MGNLKPLHQWRIQNLWKGGGDNYQSPPSFIENAYNDLYAFYTEKASFEKKSEPVGGGAPPPKLWIRHCIPLKYAE